MQPICKLEHATGNEKIQLKLNIEFFFSKQRKIERSQYWKNYIQFILVNQEKNIINFIFCCYQKSRVIMKLIVCLHGWFPIAYLADHHHHHHHYKGDVVDANVWFSTKYEAVFLYKISSYFIFKVKKNLNNHKIATGKIQ